MIFKRNNYQVIDFTKFMKREYYEKPKQVHYSFVPLVFNTGNIFFAGLGLAIIGMALYEKYLVMEGKEYEAEVVSMIMNIVLPAGGIIGGLYSIDVLRGVFFL